jgi:hypothetical protein
MSWHTGLLHRYALNPNQFSYFHGLQTINILQTDIIIIVIVHHRHMGKNLLSTDFVYVKSVKYNLKVCIIGMFLFIYNNHIEFAVGMFMFYPHTKFQIISISG